jgi:hypothetical protein
MDRNSEGKRLLEKICAAGYGALLLIAAVAAYRTTDRDWNWDALAYIGCAASWSESDPAKIHDQAYTEARRQMPADVYQLLTESNAYRRDLARNPSHFVEQLPFYNGKVLYVALIVGLHRMGASYVGAMKILSAAGFFALGLVFFRWAQDYVRPLPASILSAALMMSAPVWNLARTFSPDALSVAIITAGFYALFAVAPARAINQRWAAAIPAIALLIAAIFVRNDTLLLTVFVIGYLAVASRSPVRLKRSQAAALILLLVASVLALGHLTGGYGWRMSFYHGLVERVPAPAEVQEPVITVADYLHAAARSAREAADWSSLGIFTFLAAGCLLLRKRRTLMRDLLLVNVAFSLVRLLFYPGFEERYYVSTYVVAAICLIAALLPDSGGPVRLALEHPDPA